MVGNSLGFLVPERTTREPCGGVKRETPSTKEMRWHSKTSKKANAVEIFWTMSMQGSLRGKEGQESGSSLHILREGKKAVRRF